MRLTRALAAVPAVKAGTLAVVVPSDTARVANNGFGLFAMLCPLKKYSPWRVTPVDELLTVTVVPEPAAPATSNTPGTVRWE